jgi:hypothetical protein
MRLPIGDHSQNLFSAVVGKIAILRQPSDRRVKLNILSLRIAANINDREDRGAYSQAGTCCLVPDLWFRAGEECELSTSQPRAEPHRDRLLACMGQNLKRHHNNRDGDVQSFRIGLIVLLAPNSSSLF